MRRFSSSQHAFSLLEVMVAVSILGLALTVILSAQGGLSASNKSAKNMGTASTLARCKMTELEEKLLKFGYPLIDDVQTDVACCDEDKDPDFTCDIKTEKVMLPSLPNGDAGVLEGGTLPSLSLGSEGGIVDNAAASPSGAFTGFASLDLEAGISGIGTQMQGQLASVGGTDGLMSMVMGIVYPSLKIMMEASIRRLSVTVRWREGHKDKTFMLTQYVTSPQSGGFDGDAGTATAPSGSAGSSVLPQMPSFTGIGTSK